MGDARCVQVEGDYSAHQVLARAPGKYNPADPVPSSFPQPCKCSHFSNVSKHILNSTVESATTVPPKLNILGVRHTLSADKILHAISGCQVSSLIPGFQTSLPTAIVCFSPLQIASIISTQLVPHPTGIPINLFLQDVSFQ